MSDEAAVRELDRAWNRAYLERDLDALASVLADDWLGLSARHEVITRAQLLDAQRGAPQGAAITFEEGQVYIFGSAALTTGRTEVKAPGVHVRQRFTRVYVKRAGRWQAAAVQLVPLEET